MPTRAPRARAGVAHNKILAKLASGLHKPAQQTVVPLAAVRALLAPLPIGRLRQLGGKFGEQLMAGLGIATVGAGDAARAPRHAPRPRAPPLRRAARRQLRAAARAAARTARS